MSTKIQVNYLTLFFNVVFLLPELSAYKVRHISWQHNQPYYINTKDGSTLTVDNRDNRGIVAEMIVKELFGKCEGL